MERNCKMSESVRTRVCFIVASTIAWVGLSGVLSSSSLHDDMITDNAAIAKNKSKNFFIAFNIVCINMIYFCKNEEQILSVWLVIIRKLLNESGLYYGQVNNISAQI